MAASYGNASSSSRIPQLDMAMPSLERQSRLPLRSLSPGKENRRPLTPERSSSSNDVLAKDARKQRARSVSPSKGLRLRSRKKSSMPVGDEPFQASSMPFSNGLDIHQAFLEMLNEMQVPAQMISKLVQVEPRVKESMMKGQATLSLASTGLAGSKAKIRSPVPDFPNQSYLDVMDREGTSNGSNVPSSRLSPVLISSSSANSAASMNVPSSLQSAGPFTMHANASTFSVATSKSHSRSTSFGKEALQGSDGPVLYATMLKTVDSAHLDVSRVKKMRVVLSSESPKWLGDFFDEGGYDAMLYRLKELSDMEWREEQHDDQVLHELLRCFNALSSTSIGQDFLASSFPSPFAETSNLLFSEKRPGDLSTRKLLIELMCVLSRLPRPFTSRHAELTNVRSSRVSSKLIDRVAKGSNSNDNLVLLLSLLHNTRKPDEEALIEFVAASHTPRPFKMFVTELLNVNRDYFWVFCHSANRFWSVTKVDIQEAKGPKVPGGMTGGVEFEAMSYLTALWRMINDVCNNLNKLSSKDSTLVGLEYEFHRGLFDSGIERTLAITRKASQTYYQELHFELAQFFESMRRSSFRLPAELEAWQNAPQYLPVQKTLPSLVNDNSPCSTTTSQAPPQLAVRNADLGPPLLNPHNARIGSGSECNRQITGNRQSVGVSDAVRRWEERSQAGAGRQNDRAVANWLAPKEWS